MSSDDQLIGSQLGGYRIDRVLGRGGMATVYYGWDVKLERPVAVKVIDVQYQADPAYAQRFLNEARSVAGWHHPNILQVYSAGDQAGLYYFAMEFVLGKDLAALLDQYRRQGQLLPLPEVMRIGRAVANGLDYAHERGIIHRDVKPANVMVAEDGRVVLMDFGLAMNVTQGTMGTVFGSPQYFAPEQARNSANAVPQSDVYSLGVMLYEMLTGRVPFDDPSPTALAMQHIGQEPPRPRLFNPALSAGVEAVLLKALAKDPQSRFQTGRSLMDALGQALDDPPPTMPFLEGQPHAAGPLASASRGVLAGLAAIGAFLDARLLGPVGRRLGGLWSLARRNPAGEAITDYLHDHPAARLGAGLMTALLLVEAVWFAGASFRYGWEAAAKLPAGTPAPTVVAAAGATPRAGRSTPTPPAGPSATSAPAATPLPPTPTASAGAGAPGQGDHFVMYYDDTAFYLRNASNHDRPISPIAFERLDKQGKPTNRWDGGRWAQFYPISRAGSCEVIQLIDYTTHLDPPECANRHIVVRTPFANDPGIFWTTQKMVTQFRVLWNNKEVGRCDIAAKTCDVYLP